MAVTYADILAILYADDNDAPRVALTIIERILAGDDREPADPADPAADPLPPGDPG